MSDSPEAQIQQLKSAMAALEAQRLILGDAVVEAGLKKGEELDWDKTIEELLKG